MRSVSLALVALSGCAHVQQPSDFTRAVEEAVADAEREYLETGKCTPRVEQTCDGCFAVGSDLLGSSKHFEPTGQLAEGKSNCAKRELRCANSFERRRDLCFEARLRLERTAVSLTITSADGARTELASANEGQRIDAGVATGTLHLDGVRSPRLTLDTVTSENLVKTQGAPIRTGAGATLFLPNGLGVRGGDPLARIDVTREFFVRKPTEDRRRPALPPSPSELSRAWESSIELARRELVASGTCIDTSLSKCAGGFELLVTTSCDTAHDFFDASGARMGRRLWSDTGTDEKEGEQLDCENAERIEHSCDRARETLTRNGATAWIDGRDLKLAIGLNEVRWHGLEGVVEVDSRGARPLILRVTSLPNVVSRAQRRSEPDVRLLQVGDRLELPVTLLIGTSRVLVSARSHFSKE